jgi:hypothetical protein
MDLRVGWPTYCFGPRCGAKARDKPGFSSITAPIFSAAISRRSCDPGTSDFALPLPLRRYQHWTKAKRARN